MRRISIYLREEIFLFKILLKKIDKIQEIIISNIIKFLVIKISKNCRVIRRLWIEQFLFKHFYSFYYFNARWNDPRLGRFITENPIKDGNNWYIYVGNDPINYIDPSGLEKKSWDSFDLYNHYLSGGEDLTLSQIGQLKGVYDAYHDKDFLSKGNKSISERFESQISSAAQEIANSKSSGEYELNTNFSRSYDFGSTVWAFGSSTLSGEFSGSVLVDDDGSFSYSGTAEISYSDVFTDPYDTFDLISGEWNPNGDSYGITGSWMEEYSGG